MLATNLSLKSTSFNIFTNNVPIILDATLIRWSPSVMKILMFRLVMVIGSFGAGHWFGLRLFFTFFIYEAGKKLLTFKFCCKPVSKKQMAVYKKFEITPVDLCTQYAVFSFASTTSFVFLFFSICLYFYFFFSVLSHISFFA